MRVSGLMRPIQKRIRLRKRPAGGHNEVCRATRLSSSGGFCYIDRLRPSHIRAPFGAAPITSSRSTGPRGTQGRIAWERKSQEKVVERSVVRSVACGPRSATARAELLVFFDDCRRCRQSPGGTGRVVGPSGIEPVPRALRKLRVWVVVRAGQAQALGSKVGGGAGHGR